MYRLIFTIIAAGKELPGAYPQASNNHDLRLRRAVTNQIHDFDSST